MDILNRYLEFLLGQLQNDAQGFTHWSMFFIIPALFYFIFLVLKYVVLLLPVSIPLGIIASIFRRPSKNK